MKFSEQWLREFVNPDLSSDELLEQLTMAGLEVDSVEPVAGQFDGVVVGEILAVDKHPDADNLVVCQVDGGKDKFQVVCGAPNARPGIKVPFALVGANLDDFKIKKAKLRGVESFGMLCSEKELGLSDNHEGLMELPADAPVGEDVREYLELDDITIDLDLTPNRSDCLGLIGVGREAGIMGNIEMKPFEVSSVSPTIDDTFPVELAEPDACPRFVGRVIRDIDVNAETPFWMKEKLRRCGLRSIDPVVDVTNFVMMELGHPMHAYDLDKLAGKIVVRMSKKGEKVTLLDESNVELNDETLLITDESGPIGLAGIMGGLSTAVTESSTNIFFECAFFSPTAIAGRARSYGMNTDASHRFERGVDWQGQVRAVERATALLLDIAGGEAGPTIDNVAEAALPQIKAVPLRASRVKKLLGVDVSDAEIDRMLTQLHFNFAKEDGDDTTWTVTAPSHRFDIAIEADLIEEISRIYGYNTLPVRTPVTSLAMVPAPEGKLTLDRIRDQLVTRGYQEAITYSFVDAKSNGVLDPANEPIGIANPLSSEMGVMRTTLWTGLIKSAMYNLNRQQSRVRLFEAGLRFLQLPNKGELTMANITQEMMVAGVATGPRHVESWGNSGQQIDFFDVKGDLETVLALCGNVDEFSFGSVSHPALHPGQAAEIKRGDVSVGYIGLMDPRAQQQLDISQALYLFELKVAALESRRVPSAVTLSRFPEVRRDIAVIVDADMPVAGILAAVKDAAGEFLVDLKVFDVYQGKGVEPGKKSVALGLTFQALERTLTEEEVGTIVEAVVKALGKQFGASLR